ncbi:MAG: hypothetical protein ABGW78_03605 [Pirellulales bacterium]
MSFLEFEFPKENESNEHDKKILSVRVTDETLEDVPLHTVVSDHPQISPQSPMQSADHLTSVHYA